MKPTWGTEDLSDCPEGSFRLIPCADSPVSQAMLACNGQLAQPLLCPPAPQPFKATQSGASPQQEALRLQRSAASWR